MAQHTKRQFVVVVGERAIELFAGLGARRRALVRARDLGGATAMSVGEYVTRAFVPEDAAGRARKAEYVAREDAAWEKADLTLAELSLAAARPDRCSTWAQPTPDAEAAEAARAEAARLAVDLTGVRGRH